MKTTLVSLIGNPHENLYQLGLKEAQAFRSIEERVTRLLSTNTVLRNGQTIVSRARAMLKKKEESFFQQCIRSYSEGLGIDPSRYMSFLALFELAAHHGQTYPELKGILPGCTSLFEKNSEGISHSRLIDFPLVGIFDENPTLYYWKFDNMPSVLNYSTMGLAPLFFQCVHSSGTSFALHHKPGEHFHRDGQSIFQIAFELLFDCHQFSDFKKEIKKKASVTKWGILTLESNGQVQTYDIDGPNLNLEFFDLNESSPLIFTNIPIQKDQQEEDRYLQFCEDRQIWLKEKLKQKKTSHALDLMTDIEDQKTKHWVHPTATLSSVGAIHTNLTKGFVDVKEGEGALTASDPIIRFSLGEQTRPEIIKEKKHPSAFERAWKKASHAQSAFDQGQLDVAYHEIQMSIGLMPAPVWREILSFYLTVWDFLFVTNKQELAIVYQQLKKLRPPPQLKDLWLFQCMRLEKRLNLAPTVEVAEVSPHLQAHFLEEKESSKPVFTAWMKLLYPRIEILDIFSPHHK